MTYTKGEITDRALIELRLRGCDVWRQNNISVRGRAFTGRLGMSDIIGMTSQGLFVAAEVKTIGDKFSQDQINFLTGLKRCGGIALIATQEGNEIVIKDFDPSEMIAGKIIKSILKKRA